MVSKGRLARQRHPSADTESASNSLSTSSPSQQNGVSSSSDEDSDDETTEQNGSQSLDVASSRRSGEQYPIKSVHASHESLSNTKQITPYADALSHSNSVEETVLGGAVRKRKHGTADAGESGSDETTPNSTSSSPRQIHPNHAKRMRVDPAGAMDVTGDASRDTLRDSTERLYPNKSKMPPAIWHRVFSYVPPESLASLLRVNHDFNIYLTPPPRDTTFSTAAHDRNSSSEALDADAIWSMSRKLFYPEMPRPLRTLSELDMWKLLHRRSCQFCEKLGSSTVDNVGENVWQSGPGDNGVKVIWQFGVCSCGPCLQEKSVKEVTLLISSSIPSSLLPALPFLFLTPDMHAITPSTLQTSVPPPTLQMVKIYFKQHIEEIRHEFEEVSALGPAASEEWFKGLEGLGKERMSDALRCERWEAKGGLKGLLSKSLVRNTVIPAPIPSSHDTSNIGDEAAMVSESANMNTTTGGRQLAIEYSSSNVQKETASAPPPRFALSPVDIGHGHPVPPYTKHSRGERTIQEVNERKAHRRAEIERRCLEFNPPLEPSVLNHMDAFQAALQIPTPLTNQAWEVLKPRILAQREAAEKREKDRVLQSQQYQQKFEERRQIEAKVKEAKEIMDREWDDVQQPVRDLLGRYADEVIKENWKGGELITKDNSPKFAADVLIYVRQRFYAQIAQEDAATRAAGCEPIRDLPESPPKRKLILENMKWVFDTKIKPLTEHYRKELFLCSGCHDNFKFYGFEGVIQHYAAKHTNALSSGAIVVHWRAEWPEQHPFHSDPGSAKASFYMASPALGAAQLTIGAPMHFPGFAQDPGLGPYMAPHSMHGYSQFSPGPHGHPQYAGRPPPHSHGPYAPPQGYPNPQGFQGPAGFQGGPTGFQVAPPSFQGPSPGYQGVQGFQGVPQGYQGYSRQYPGHPPATFNAPSPGPPYGQVIHAPPSAVAQGYRPKTGPYGQPPGPGAPYPQPYQQPGALAPVGPLQNVPNSTGQSSEMYQIQLDKMAAIAREIFFAMSGIKDLPGSVRISVVIHHMVSKFMTEFANEPSLAMFTDGLNSHASMRPIRNVNGVPCKVCADALNGVSNGSNGTFHSRPRLASTGDRKPIFPLPTLLLHFQTAHIERVNPPIIPQGGISAPRLDWKEDMIELPDMSVISGLLRAQGMDDNKLKLLAQVFPKAFPVPLPRLGPANNTGPVPVKQEEGTLQASEFSSRDTSTAIDTNLSRAGSRNGSYASFQRPQSHVQSIVPSPTNTYPPHRGSASAETASNEKPRGIYERRHSSYYVSSGHEYQETGVSRYPQQGRRDGRVLRNPGDRDLDRYYQHPPRHEDGDRGEYRSEDRRSRPVVTPLRSDPRDRYVGRYHMRAASRTRSQSPRDHLDCIEYERCRSPGFHATRGSRVAGPTEHSSLLHSPVTPVPGREKEVGQTGVAGEGSEDGEVGDGAAIKNEEDSSDSSLADVNAAERFLEEFLPGEDAAEEYKRKAAEHDRRKEEKMKAKWLAEREAEERKKKAEDDAPDTPERSYNDRTRTSESKDLRRTPVRNVVAGSTSRTGDAGSPPRGDWSNLQHNYGVTEQFGRSSLLPRQRERSPELVDPRYVQPAASYRNERHASDSTRRPRGRYDQFEAYRQERYRNRSRSPVTARVVLEEDYYTPGPRSDQLYRTRSPRPMQRQLSGGSPASLVRPYGRTYADAQGFYPAHYVQERMYVSGRVDARSPDSATLPGGRLVRQELPPTYVTVDEDYHRGRAIYAEREHTRR